MQTFLPYSDFTRTAESLHWRHLGKQRLEARTIINIWTQSKSGWKNHPASQMWRNHADALKLYFNIISEEWVRRGYKHTMGFYPVSEVVMPEWIGDEAFHLAHMSNLVRKKPEHYGVLFPNVPNDLPYVWPSQS